MWISLRLVLKSGHALLLLFDPLIEMALNRESVKSSKRSFSSSHQLVLFLLEDEGWRMSLSSSDLLLELDILLDCRSVHLPVLKHTKWAMWHFSHFASNKRIIHDGSCPSSALICQAANYIWQMMTKQSIKSLLYLTSTCRVFPGGWGSLSSYETST